ncbi:MAG: hypothetical protein GF308_19225 [Candidatus Heimdallarchaeota archaeon]|nr:hypothetical protein [Candidatus Heimdallarchaeota archaeon]
MMEDELVNKDGQLAEKDKSLSNQKKALITSIILIIITGICSVIISLVIINTTPKITQGAIKWIPGGIIVELIVIWIFPILFSLIVIPFLPYIAKFYIHLHKLIKLFNHEYSLVTTKETFVKITKVLKRSLMPVLLSFTIGFWFADKIGEIIEPFQELTLVGYLLFAILFIPLTILIAMPLWLLDDTGIISLKKREEGERKLPEVEGPSSYFEGTFIGLTYSLAIISIVFFILRIIERFEPVAFILFLGLLIVLFLEVISINYLYEIVYRKYKTMLLNKLPERLVDKKPKIIIDLKSLSSIQEQDHPKELSE